MRLRRNLNEQSQPPMSNLAIDYIEIDAIDLDFRNPRVAPALEGLQEVPEQEFIGLALGQYAPEDEERGASTSYSSLKASIRAYRGLIHPIVVTPTGGGRFVVIEGNTRVAIYRELAKEKAPGDWGTIPAIKREVEEVGEHAIRLQAHLVGPRPWRPYAKAKYLHSLYTDQKLSLNEILDYCGGNAKKRDIEEYISAYNDMQESYMPLVGQNPPDLSRFSAFVELQKPGIKQAILKAGFTLDNFAEWVHESRINPLNSVRQLPRILANPQAKKQFLLHDAREALKILDQPSSSAILREATLDQLAQALAMKIRGLSWSEVKSLMESPSERAQTLLDCFDELKQLCDQIGAPAAE